MKKQPNNPTNIIDFAAAAMRRADPPAATIMRRGPRAERDARAARQAAADRSGVRRPRRRVRPAWRQHRRWRCIP